MYTRWLYKCIINSTRKINNFIEYHDVFVNINGSLVRWMPASHNPILYSVKTQPNTGCISNNNVYNKLTNYLHNNTNLALAALNIVLVNQMRQGT